MNLLKIGILTLVGSTEGMTFAATDLAPRRIDPSTLAVTYPAKPQAGAAAIGAVAATFLKPRFGVRIGGGPWNEFMVVGGVDVTFNVPVLPIPALRVDAEVWGKPSGFGKDRRGNALSVLGVQTFLLGYAGVGPTYYFTDDNGDHKSGIGAKALVGFTLPASLFVEGSLILGPKRIPLFITVGQHF